MHFSPVWQKQTVMSLRLSNLNFITIIDILKQKIDLKISVRIFFVPEPVAKKR